MVYWGIHPTDLLGLPKRIMFPFIVVKIVILGMLHATRGYVTPVRQSWLDDVTLIDGTRDRGLRGHLLPGPTKRPRRWLYLLPSVDDYMWSH